MTLLSRRDDLAANIVIVISAIALAFLLIVLILQPMPKAEGLQSKHRRDMRTAEQATVKARDRIKELDASIATVTWTGAAQQVGPIALSKVTALAKARGVKLNQFRPQRTVTVGDLTQQPFLASVEGPYPAVIAFAKDLETRDTRLAVNLIQVSSADANTDRVLASIGVVAYLRPEAKETTRAKK